MWLSTLLACQIPTSVCASASASKSSDSLYARGKVRVLVEGSEKFQGGGSSVETIDGSLDKPLKIALQDLVAKVLSLWEV